MNFSDIISSVLEKMRKAGGVEVAFGNPQTVNNLTIIPVAKVSYGFGAGGGKSVKVNKQKIRPQHLYPMQLPSRKQLPVKQLPKQKPKLPGLPQMISAEAGVVV
jgi:hypothetical protein